MVDLRPYHGHWEYMNKLDTDVIKQAMEDWKTWEDRPNSCTLDWGVIRTNGLIDNKFIPNYTNKYKEVNNFKTKGYIYKTILIEANSGCCFGPYSTNAINYAKMISAAISKVSGTPDECYFGQIIKP